MLKKLSIFTILALATNFAQASKLPTHTKPAHEEAAPEAKRAQIENAASQSSEATTSLAASPAVNTHNSASSLVAAACSASGAAAASAKKKTSKTEILDILEVIPERNLQNILLGYLDKWQEGKTLKGHSKTVSCVEWSPDDKQLVSCSPDNVKIWNLATQEAKTITVPNGAGIVLSVAWNPDGKHVAFSQLLDTTIIWDVANWTEVNTFKGHKAVWSPNSRLLAYASNLFDKTVRIWNVATGEEVKNFTGWGDMFDQIECIAWSPDCKQLACVRSGRPLRICDIETGTSKTLTGDGTPVQSVAYSPDGKQLAAAQNDTIIIWDVATNKEVKTLNGHTDVVYSVAWSPDGKQLASGSLDYTVKIWDLANGKELQTLTGHNKHIGSVAWSRNGNCIASGSGDETIKIWQNQAREIELADASNKSVREALDPIMADQKPLQEIILGYLGLY